ncbi:MmgE/PrpD family protein [Agrobacterium vitis]|nr:MmgE/PrpD family protein [Agrobacterium vitis]MCF1464669.1 MmgE/PrpD family protein [Allorhizobium ampelinum]MCF1455745.1 MmgE/PrpD family protein [Agrobacterium vitis]MCF1469944.1 MmgE/PrpD family protein [Agrobacterium vitis]MCF1485308.1 MmgE/PrpD family protein [Allorhizobium ampelinum]
MWHGGRVNSSSCSSWDEILSKVRDSLSTFSGQVHADDFDDTSEHTMNGHPSAPIVSALIPTAYMVGATGADVVRAYAVGIEVACKLGSAIGAGHTRRGWHTISTLGTLGATAATANLRGLDFAQTERALAIACSFAGGILGNTGTMTKSLHCGRAAQAGYMASALASEGFTSGADILETEAGFLDTFTDRSLSEIDVTELGKVWDLVAPGLAVKLYPCCSCTHRAIDGAIDLRQLHAPDPKTIEQITCTVREECTHYLRFPNPKTGIEAKFSMNYTVAVALSHGKVTLGDFETTAISRDEVAMLVPKVRMVVPSDEKESGGVEVVLKDGRRFTTHRKIPRGAPEDPPTWDDVIGKLRDGLARARKARPVHPEALFAGLQEMGKRSQFVDLLRP